ANGPYISIYDADLNRLKRDRLNSSASFKGDISSETVVYSSGGNIYLRTKQNNWEVEAVFNNTSQSWWNPTLEKHKLFACTDIPPNGDIFGTKLANQWSRPQNGIWVNNQSPESAYLVNTDVSIESETIESSAALVTSAYDILKVDYDNEYGYYLYTDKREYYRHEQWKLGLDNSKEWQLEGHNHDLVAMSGTKLRFFDIANYCQSDTDFMVGPVGPGHDRSVSAGFVEIKAADVYPTGKLTVEANEIVIKEHFHAK
ncbi:hypothetical protein, partial [Fulvivirga aurantia]|uniref:hypothetical protein n=1 Tax=Fulvivirga aurantia TaxID=2529383 RepID=UPI001629C627